MSSPAPSLVRKLALVMASVDHIAKRGRNDFHKYDYATESDIVAAVRMKLAEQHVMLVPSVKAMHREPVGEKGSVLTTLEMEFTFMDGETGEIITQTWIGAGTDKEDKGAYKAMTGAAKYFLLKTFLIPTGDDPEASDGDGQATRDRIARRQAGRTTSAQVESVRERLQGDASPAASTPTSQAAGDVISEGQWKRFWAVAREKGWADKDVVKAWLLTMGIPSSKKIPRRMYDDVVTALDQGPPADKAALLAKAAELSADIAAQVPF